jgi:hypothetical protein
MNDVRPHGCKSLCQAIRSRRGAYNSFSEKHQHRYVEGFAYRPDKGNCKVRTLDRTDTRLCRMVGRRVTYVELTLAV